MDNILFYCYKITNTVNSKVYIGITNNPKQRWAAHTKYKNKHEGSDRPLYRAINKYSSDNFRMDILSERNSWDEICEEEIKYIKQYNSFWTHKKGYNLTTGGQGTPNVVVSDKTKLKLSIINKLNKGYSYLEKYYKDNPGIRSIQQKKAMLNDKTRKKISLSVKKHMSNPENVEISRNGALSQWKNMSDDEMAKRTEKMRQVALKLHKDKTYRDKLKKACFKSVIGNGIKYKSVTDCAKANNVAPNTITGRCQNLKNKEFYYINTGVNNG
jgi:group I intron endonuclease